MIDLRIVNVQPVLPDGAVIRADVAVKDGLIAGIMTPGEPATAGAVIDGRGLHLLPGIIDAHVHIGFYDAVDENRTETAAAALGGVTTTLRYFRALKPYDELFPRELELAKQLSHVDYAFHLGILTDHHLENIENYIERWGIRSFKMYTCYKGEERAEFGLRGQDDGFMYAVFRKLATLGGAFAMVHSENNDIVERETNRLKGLGQGSMGDLDLWDQSRPAVAELEAVQRVATLAEQASCPIYFPHVSASSALKFLAGRKSVGQELYVETLSAYLGLDLSAPGCALATVNPPIRGGGNIEAQWQAIRQGVTDVVATDHCPTPRPRKKPGAVLESVSGIPGVTTLLPSLLSEGVNKGRIPLGKIAQLQKRTADIFQLPTKGAITVGKDADMVLVDLQRERQVHGADYGSIADYVAYEDTTLKGWPEWTMLRGEVIAENGTILGHPGDGHNLRS